MYHFTIHILSEVVWVSPYFNYISWDGEREKRQTIHIFAHKTIYLDALYSLFLTKKKQQQQLTGEKIIEYDQKVFYSSDERDENRKTSLAEKFFKIEKKKKMELMHTSGEKVECVSRENNIVYKISYNTSSSYLEC